MVSDLMTTENDEYQDDWNWNVLKKRTILAIGVAWDGPFKFQTAFKCCQKFDSFLVFE